MTKSRCTIFALVAVALLGGCTTSRTAKPVDGDNLLWPLCGFDEKHGRNWIVPVFWGKNYIDILPLLWWHYDQSCILFPISWWKRNRYYTLFPLWWSDERRRLLIPLYYEDENSIAIIPFYGKTSHVDRFTDWYGPYGRHRSERAEENSDWFIPFYYRDNGGWTTPLFGWDRNMRSSWVFPLYYRDHYSFVSLPWTSKTRGGESFWSVPLALTWGSCGKDGSSEFSVLWRLFRSAYDPQEGRKVDLLFIPVWR